MTPPDLGWPAPLTTPGPCYTCRGIRWWKAPDLWGLLLCAGCYPPPKGVDIVEVPVDERP